VERRIATGWLGTGRTWQLVKRGGSRHEIFIARGSQDRCRAGDTKGGNATPSVLCQGGQSPGGSVLSNGRHWALERGMGPEHAGAAQGTEPVLAHAAKARACWRR
jgi:hypothetical protein